MAKSEILKEAIADAKAVKATALENAKAALEEAFTPKLQSMLSKKLESELEEEVEEEETVAEKSAKNEEDDEEYEDEEEMEEAIEEMEGEEEDEDEEEEVEENLDLESVIADLEADLEEIADTKQDPHDDDDMNDDEIEESIDLDAILSEVEAEMLADLNEEEEDIYEDTSRIEALEDEIRQYKEAVSELRAQLNEVNMLNQKLFYVNKLFKQYDLTNEQKTKVIEALDRTSSVREIKLVYSTVAESLAFKAEQAIESTKRVTESIASNITGTTKSVITESDEATARLQKLAGIKK